MPPIPSLSYGSSSGAEAGANGGVNFQGGSVSLGGNNQMLTYAAIAAAGLALVLVLKK